MKKNIESPSTESPSKKWIRLGKLYWLVVEPTPLKNMGSSIGMMTSPIYGKIICSKPPTSIWSKATKGHNFPKIHNHLWWIPEPDASQHASQHSHRGFAQRASSSPRLWHRRSAASQRCSCYSWAVLWKFDPITWVASGKYIYKKTMEITMGKMGNHRKTSENHRKMVVEWDFMGIPSGKLTYNYGKSPSLNGKSIGKP